MTILTTLQQNISVVYLTFFSFGPFILERNFQDAICTITEKISKNNIWNLQFYFSE